MGNDADYVTGLGPRGRFEAELDALLHGQASFALLIVDVVGLKRINIEGGFVRGDAALRAAAERLRTTTAGSTGACGVYRLGGDELVAVYTGADATRRATEATRVILESDTHPALRAGVTTATPGEPRYAMLDRLYATVRRS